MEFLSELWLPIVVSAFLVWIASFLIHMVLPHHKGEFKGLPNEEAVASALQGVPPDQYMFPYGTMADIKSDEFKAKMARGPNGIMTIWPGPVNMGRNIMLTFLFYLVVGVFVAYVSWHAFQNGSPAYLDVFRIAGTAAFMAHGLGWIPTIIWYGGKGFWTYTFDAIVYALLTAGVFGWLWPGV